MNAGVFLDRTLQTGLPEQIHRQYRMKEADGIRSPTRQPVPRETDII